MTIELGRGHRAQPQGRRRSAEAQARQEVAQVNNKIHIHGDVGDPEDLECKIINALKSGHQIEFGPGSVEDWLMDNGTFNSDKPFAYGPAPVPERLRLGGWLKSRWDRFRSK